MSDPLALPREPATSETTDLRRHVFVVDLDERHEPLLRGLPAAAECDFHPLLRAAKLHDPQEVRFQELLERAHEELDAFPGRVDGITGYWDFPTTCLVPVLCQERGLPGPPLDAVLRCEHKYWSRRLQQEVIPEHVPAFCAVDPFAGDAASSIGLDFPFWLKPVKSFNAYLGFRIDGPDDLERALERIRRGIGSLGEPFDHVLSRIERPEAIAGIGGHWCIAEEIISAGRQCTVEGWSTGEEIDVYGVVDSFRHAGGSSFSGYQYPSRLPPEVQHELAVISLELMRHVGYRGAPFNIEYFWDEETGRIWLLEVNSRISQSHSELFAKVDGAANHAVAVDLALGRRPTFVHREGEFARAAKFYERAFEDAVVRSVPDAERIAEIEERFPGTRIHPTVEAGTRLSELSHQDSYSYELAWIYMGAKDDEALQRNHERVVEMLGIELEPVDDCDS